MKENIKLIESSFRDPNGYLFWQDRKLYRSINNSYKNHYNYLIQSGLYKKLTENNFLVSHEEIDNQIFYESTNTFKIISPEIIPFISYPYEWSFSQLKDAALLTLNIQEIALDYGMSLKDASSYNVQFKNGKPIFIDTLSFENYEEGKPWIAYKQFCQHFFAPLSLMAHTDIRLSQLFKNNIDGIPLDLASKLLPLKTHFRPSTKLHIHIHSKLQKKFEDSAESKSKNKRTISKTALKGIINNLKNSISNLKWNIEKTEWRDYYDDDSYTENGFLHKQEIINSLLSRIHYETAWDLGANDGTFSRLIAKNRNCNVVSFDIDPACVEKNYLYCSENKLENILPLSLDLTNPSPNIGWNNCERSSIQKRGPVDLIMALALIHHLAISNNVPLEKIALFLKNLCKFLIIEFVPKSDKKVKKLLSTREDIFPEYNQEKFEKIFSKHFEIFNEQKINESERIICLMRKIS